MRYPTQCHLVIAQRWRQAASVASGLSTRRAEQASYPNRNNSISKIDLFGGTKPQINANCRLKAAPAKNNTDSTDSVAILVIQQPKGLTVFLAQPKELKVPQGWVGHCPMIPRANGLTVRRTIVTNGQTVGPLLRENLTQPCESSILRLG